MDRQVQNSTSDDKAPFSLFILLAAVLVIVVLTICFFLIPIFKQNSSELEDRILRASGNTDTLFDSKFSITVINGVTGSVINVDIDKKRAVERSTGQDVVLTDVSLGIDAVPEFFVVKVIYVKGSKEVYLNLNIDSGLLVEFGSLFPKLDEVIDKWIKLDEESIGKLIDKYYGEAAERVKQEFSKLYFRDSGVASIDSGEIIIKGLVEIVGEDDLFNIRMLETDNNITEIYASLTSRAVNKLVEGVDGSVIRHLLQQAGISSLDDRETQTREVLKELFEKTRLRVSFDEVKNYFKNVQITFVDLESESGFINNSLAINIDKVEISQPTQTEIPNQTLTPLEVDSLILTDSILSLPSDVPVK